MILSKMGLGLTKEQAEELQKEVGQARQTLAGLDSVPDLSAAPAWVRKAALNKNKKK